MRASLINQVSAVALAAFATAGLAAVSTADAGSLTFTFDAYNKPSGGTVAALGDCTSSGTNCNNASVGSYMDQVLKAATGNLSWGVTTTASGSILNYNTSNLGAIGERDYTGDSHVVGPATGVAALPTTASSCTFSYCGAGSSYALVGGGVVPLTLGNTDGFTEPSGSISGLVQLGTANANSSTGVIGHLKGLDSFITNDTTPSTDKTTIGIAFTGGLKIAHIEFDFEIFPDGGCPGGAGGCSGGVPDLTFKYKDKNGVIQTVTQFVGDNPLDGDTRSPSLNPETAPQLLSHAGFDLNGATELYFQDWPATIGIDNIQITWNNAPEPATFAIFGTALAGFGWMRRRRRTVAQA